MAANNHPEINPPQVKKQKDLECVERCQYELNYAKLSPNGVCKVFDIPSDEYKTMKVRNPANNKSINISVGRAALIVQKETFFIDPNDENFEASHLCHNKNCVLTCHLSAEPHAVNNSRKACVNYGFCLGHGTYPACLVHLKMW